MLALGCIRHNALHCTTSKHSRVTKGASIFPTFCLAIPRHFRCDRGDLTCDYNTRMASSYAQDLILSDRLVNRHYVRIPPEQKKLLNRDDAWSDSLCSGPRGMLNVPEQVLEHVKSLHIRHHRRTPSTQNLPAAEAATAVTSKRQQSVSRPPPDSDDDADDAIQRTPSNWSSSSRPDEADDPAQEPAGKGVLDIEAAPPASTRRPPESQSPPPHHGKKSRSQFPANVPASDMTNSDDLDIQAPGYLSQESGFPVNRGALRIIASTGPEPTPPSAQLPVASARPPAPVDTGHRTDGVPSMEHGGMARQTAIAALEMSKWGTSGLIVDQKSSTTTATSSSVLSTGAQSLSEKPSQLRPPPLFDNPAGSKNNSSNLTATWEGRHQGSPCPQVTSAKFLAPAYGNAPPNAQPKPLTPYEEFKAAYPDYPESSRIFVCGCLNVQQLMRDNMLMEFLYDDFVRAFSKFTMYISECNRRKKKDIMLAVNWYYRTYKYPEYCKKIIRQDNIDGILEAHADDVNTIRRALPDSQSTESNSVVTNSDDQMPEAPIGGDEQNVEVEESGLEDTHQFRPSPAPHQGESLRLTANSKPSELGHDESPTKRSKTQVGALSKQVAIPSSSSVLHLGTPSAKVADVRSSRIGISEPRVDNTPTSRKPLRPSERTTTSSSGEPITTISPVQRLQPRPSLSRPQEGQEHLQPASSSASQNLSEKRKQKPPMLVSAPRKTTDSVPPSSPPPSKKRPRSVVCLDGDEKDDNDDHDAFDPPVHDLMPPPPKKTARNVLKRPGMSQPPAVKHPMSTPPMAARKSYPSSMPAAAAAARPTFTPSGLGAAGQATSFSRPSTSALSHAVGGDSWRSASSLADRSNTDTIYVGKEKPMSGFESPEERTRRFKKYCEKKKLLGSTASSSSPVARKQ